MLFTAGAAIYTALSARFSITKVPWLRLFKNPEFLGGWSGIRLHAWWVFVWVLASCAVSTVLICTIQLGGTPLAKKIYALLYQGDLEGSGEIHLIGYIVITVLGHLFLARRTYHVVRKQRERVPKRYINNQPTPPSLELVLEKKTVIELVMELIGALYYSVPNLLAPIYLHFYHSTGPIIDTCACLLINDNPQNMLVDFYQYHKNTNPAGSDFMNLNHEVDINKPVDWPNIIATGLIRMYGFRAAERYIANYRKFIQKRKAARQRLLQQVVCSIASDSGSGDGRLVQISENGSGAYVTYSHLTLSTSQRVTLVFRDDTIIGTAVHTHAHDFGNGDRCGVGIEVKNADQSRLLELINASRSQ